MIRKCIKIVGLFAVLISGGAFATDGVHTNVRVTQHGAFDSGNYFIVVQGDNTQHLFNCTTGAGKGLLSALLTCIATGKNITMVVTGGVVNQIMQAPE